MTEKSLLRASNTDPDGKSAVRAENLGVAQKQQLDEGVLEAYMKRSEFQARTRFGLTFILAAVLLIGCAQFGFAQEATASITGKITDPSGAAVMGATITAKDMDRGTPWTAKANAEGFYTLAQLPIGRYEVSVEAAGFKTAVHPPFALDLNQTAKIDVALTIGQTSTTIEVSGGVPLLQTETTEVGTIMQSEAITSLPLETRNYNQLTLLMPGAVTTSPGAFNSGQSTFNSGRPYINGNREQANYYLLDGMENVEFVDNNVAYAPNVDAMQEFNVITNNPSAEYGQFMGGVISVITKSGTNSYHGDLFEFLRNDALNANEWSRNFSTDPSVSGSPQKLRWNEFGGTFGGPIKKNKLFFFVDYQGSRFDHPTTVIQMNMFTSAEKGLNFSDLNTPTAPVTVYYPGFLPVTNSAGAVTNPGVQMPLNLNNANKCGPGQTMGKNPCISLSPTALKILAALPAAGGSETINN